MSIMGGNLEHPRLHNFWCPYRVRLLVEFADELGLSQIVLVRKVLNHSRNLFRRSSFIIAFKNQKAAAKIWP